jgi:hypothetical protein
MTKKLAVEVNSGYLEDKDIVALREQGLLMCPNPAKWLFRVDLNGSQAIVGFPKFCTVGVGFLVEEDWNTNLPYKCLAEEIWNHIKHNKGDDSISDEDCVEAIRLIQAAAKLYEEKGGVA